ncbi:hypothetical protein ECANGB1_1897 [Enterospora canceri]|uniref:Uncharacterized protein n=1 Tax=Enterospora canceri TaxID=1081671 RepID=A0A1Y1SA76_9MICR|nr:hypothetical protein ECANGB1_1897 [Enterospora canceri]
MLFLTTIRAVYFVQKDTGLFLSTTGDKFVINHEPNDFEIADTKEKEKKVIKYNGKAMTNSFKAFRNNQAKLKSASGRDNQEMRVVFTGRGTVGIANGWKCLINKEGQAKFKWCSSGGMAEFRMCYDHYCLRRYGRLGGMGHGGGHGGFGGGFGGGGYGFGFGGGFDDGFDGGFDGYGGFGGGFGHGGGFGGGFGHGGGYGDGYGGFEDDCFGGGYGHGGGYNRGHGRRRFDDYSDNGFGSDFYDSCSDDEFDKEAARKQSPYKDIAFKSRKVRRIRDNYATVDEYNMRKNMPLNKKQLQNLGNLRRCGAMHCPLDAESQALFDKLCMGIKIKTGLENGEISGNPMNYVRCCSTNPLCPVCA